MLGRYMYLRLIGHPSARNSGSFQRRRGLTCLKDHPTAVPATVRRSDRGPSLPLIRPLRACTLHPPQHDLFVARTRGPSASRSIHLRSVTACPRSKSATFPIRTPRPLRPRCAIGVSSRVLLISAMSDKTAKTGASEKKPKGGNDEASSSARAEAAALEQAKRQASLSGLSSPWQSHVMPITSKQQQKSKKQDPGNKQPKR